MIPQRTPLGHIALMALPSTYIAAQEMHLGDSYFSYEPELMLFWLGLFALVSLALHIVARWTPNVADATRANQKAIAQWSAAAAQGIVVALAFGAGLDTDGMVLGLLIGVPTAAVIGLYYGIVWLVRHFKKPALSAPEKVTNEDPPTTVRTASGLPGQTLAVAATFAVFALGTLVPGYAEEFIDWTPHVVHHFEGNAFIPVIPLVLRGLVEIGIPVALVLAFHKRLLALNLQKLVFIVAIAFIAAKGTFGIYLTSNIPLVWMSAQNAEEVLAAELKAELGTMSVQNPDRLCSYAKTQIPELISVPEPNYHFTYHGTTYGVFLSEFTPAVTELANTIGCAK